MPTPRESDALQRSRIHSILGCGRATNAAVDADASMRLTAKIRDKFAKAVEQVGFDPETAAPRAKASDGSAAHRANYLRADEACLEAHDYSVE
jgi:hypothetical protein